MAKKINNNNKNTYDELKNRLSRKTQGISSENQKEYLDIDMEDEISKIDSVINHHNLTYKKNVVSDTSLSSVSGKYKGNDISDILEDYLNSDEVKRLMSEDGRKKSIEEIREQIYFKKYMPQTGKVINNIRKLIMSPNIHSNRSLEITISEKENTQVTLSDIHTTLDNKNFDDKVGESIESALSHGTGFLYVVPYKDIAERIKENIDIINGEQKAGTEPIYKSVLYGASSGFDALFNEAANSSNSEEDEIFIGEKAMNIVLRHDEHGDTNNKLYSESFGGLKTEEKKTLDDTFQEYFSESQMTSSVVDGFKHKVSLQDQSLFAEAKYSSRRINNIKGCHVECLKNNKFIPVYIEDDFIGGYYIDSDLNVDNPIRHTLNSTSADSTGMTPNAIVQNNIIKIIKKITNDRFLSSNKYILNNIDKIVSEEISKRQMGSSFKVRFISSKYVTEFSNFNRISLLKLPAAFIHYYILLTKGYIYRKMFYETDKFVTKYTPKLNDDIVSQGYRAKRAIENMIPNPAQILNMTKMYRGLMSSHNIMIPKSENGTEAFELERIEGQKTSSETFEDLTKFENIITSLIGFPFSMLDPSANTDFAINAILADKNKLEDILSFQKRFLLPLNRVVKSVLSYEYDDDLSDTIEVNFSNNKTLRDTDFNEKTSEVLDKVDKLKQSYFGVEIEVDPAFENWVTKELTKKFAAAFIDVDYLESLKEQFELYKEEHLKDE